MITLQNKKKKKLHTDEVIRSETQKRWAKKLYNEKTLLKDNL